MKTFYCTVSKPSTELGLYVRDIRCITSEPQFEAATLEDFKRLITEYQVKYVMFHFFGWPRRPVGVDHPKMDSHIKRLIKAWNK